MLKNEGLQRVLASYREQTGQHMFMADSEGRLVYTTNLDKESLNVYQALITLFNDFRYISKFKIYDSSDQTENLPYSFLSLEKKNFLMVDVVDEFVLGTQLAAEEKAGMTYLIVKQMAQNMKDQLRQMANH